MGRRAVIFCGLRSHLTSCCAVATWGSVPGASKEGVNKNLRCCSLVFLGRIHT